MPAAAIRRSNLQIKQGSEFRIHKVAGSLATRWEIKLLCCILIRAGTLAGGEVALQRVTARQMTFNGTSPGSAGAYAFF
jgi:hypothetical protein